uniref:Uncharacterized protein n=1 Tax=Setaria digitata TaxID=48799 RepID=A0A915Q6F5_9BILA
MLSETAPNLENECRTTFAILSTIFVCLGAFVLIFLLLYLAYFKPFFDAHKYCKEKRNETEQQLPVTNELEQYDIQNQFSYPKYIYDVRITPEERHKQSYIKNHERRRRKKKSRLIPLPTINENYANNYVPKSTLISEWATDNRMYRYEDELRNRCKCRNCAFARIIRNTSTFRPASVSGRPKSHSTPV